MEPARHGWHSRGTLGIFIRTVTSKWGAACLCLLTLAAPARADGYEQRQGPALLRLHARRGPDGRVEVPLSGVTVTMRVRGGRTLHVEPEEIPPSPQGWGLRKLAGPPREAGWEQKFHLEPSGKPGDTADVQLPGLTFRAGKGPEQEVVWKPIPARVTTVVKEPTLKAARPGTGPEQVPPAPPGRPSLFWVALVLGLVVLLGLAGWKHVRRRLGRSAALPPPEWALRELRRVAALDLSSGGERERFSTLLSDVVRRYLELQFHLRASRQTTAEFLASMQQTPQLAPAQRESLRDFLQRCDLAKFARATPSAEECRVLVEQARAFVEQTALSVSGEPRASAGADALKSL